MSEWISDEEWKTIVRNVPIVSVDLIVRAKGGIVLGKRRNEPAKGEWFIPGGRVLKKETRTEAVHRVANQELSVEVDIIKSLDAFEHIYDTAEIEGVESKHYLANGYVVDPETELFHPDDQHADFQVFSSPPESLHPNVQAYIDEASSLVWE